DLRVLHNQAHLADLADDFGHLNALPLRLAAAKIDLPFNRDEPRDLDEVVTHDDAVSGSRLGDNEELRRRALRQRHRRLAPRLADYQQPSRDQHETHRNLRSVLRGNHTIPRPKFVVPVSARARRAESRATNVLTSVPGIHPAPACGTSPAAAGR